jgi:hypothetical protein
VAIRIRLLALAALTLFLVPAFAEDKLEEFRSEAGRFSVMLPGKPMEQKLTAATPGGMVDIYLFTARGEKTLYRVSYLDYPGDSVKQQGAAAVLDSNRDSFVTTVKGRLVSDKKTTLDGHPGRDFTVETDKAKFRMREFLVGSRLYQALTGGPSLDTPEIQRFQDSFKPLK